MAGERIAIAGGGAAGFFAAIACANANPANEVCIYERGSQFLTKVRISGGGRCNVTHAVSDAREFSEQYPRGERSLISALHKFSAEDTIAWFQRHGVRLKVEEDGRMFPVTDSSGTVIDCLLFEAKAAGVQVAVRHGIEAARKNADGTFQLTLTDGSSAACDRLLLATGGARDPIGAQIAHSLGHTIEPPVPSLFSLHIDTAWLRELPGVSIPEVELHVANAKLRARGPLLITHNGVSGPAVLRLSAWGARAFAALDYQFTLQVNWLPQMTEAAVAHEVQSRRETHAKKRMASASIAPLPVRLWEQLLKSAGISDETLWTNLTRSHSLALVRLLTRSELPVSGKSLNKDEFVTCGGVRLKEVDFKTMESRIVPHLYFAGELLDLDGITGGFNFQAAWTTGWIAGHAMADSPLPE